MSTNDSTDLLQGGCLCGEVRYEVRGAPEHVYHCHCTMCRRASGAAFMTWAGVKPDALAITQGTPQSYTSSSFAIRKFCGRCGGQLIWEYTNGTPLAYFTVGTLDHPERIAPDGHIWTSVRVPWLHTADGLPESEKEPEG